MEVLLSFSSIGSLRTYLNAILIGIVVFVAINKFTYIIDVLAYALAKTFIPIITSLFLGMLLGTNVTFGIGTILLLLIVYFIIGLAVIKVIEKVAAYFNFDTIFPFIILFSITDFVVSWLFLLIIRLIF